MATKKATTELADIDTNITTEEALFGDLEVPTEPETEEEQTPLYSDAPIRLTDQKTHRVYQLDYSRETVILAERAGLSWDELTNKPAFTITLAWFLAFRKNHPQVTEAEASRMLRDLGGITPELIGKMRHLYDNAIVGLMNLDGDAGKNATVTVEF